MCRFLSTYFLPAHWLLETIKGSYKTEVTNSPFVVDSLFCFDWTTRKVYSVLYSLCDFWRVGPLTLLKTREGTLWIYGPTVSPSNICSIIRGEEQINIYSLSQKVKRKQLPNVDYFLIVSWENIIFFGNFFF